MAVYEGIITYYVCNINALEEKTPIAATSVTKYFLGESLILTNLLNRVDGDGFF